MAKEIPLTRGRVAIVDAADYDWLMQWKWRARRESHGGGLCSRNFHRLQPISSQSTVIHTVSQRMGVEPGAQWD
jgi:hypothetical protein